MRTIVHLSDLHFGRVNPVILAPLLEAINRLRPDLVAVSGDLTQRARREEFQAARDFLAAIPYPQIVVPGNHDVPLYNVLSRFLRSLHRYRRYITPDLAPFFADEEIAVAGVNTARALTFKDGRINSRQIAVLRDRFAGLPDTLTKIVITHHPFDLPVGAEGERVLGRARLAMETLAHCQVDLLLAGHFHRAHVSSSATRFRIPGYSALVVSAGTSTSTRGRGQPNSFNVLRTDRAALQLECWTWQSDHARFEKHTHEHFHRTPGGWSPAA